MRIKLALPLNLSEVISVVKGRAELIEKDRAIEYITTDTRTLFCDDLFIALNGEFYDGESFAYLAVENGARALSRLQGNGFVTVHDTAEALLQLAKHYKTKLEKQKFTVAVTGSVGKTTTKNYLKCLFNGKFNTYATEENHNNLIGMPMTILSARKDTEALILEMGMNHRGEIEKMSLVAEPNIAIITNIGSSHIGNLGSREEIAKAKREVLCGIKKGRVILPYDEPLLNDISSKFTVSTESYLADCYLRQITSDGIETVFDLYLEDIVIKNLKAEIGAPHNLYNLGYAISAFYLAGATDEEICEGLIKIGQKDLRYRLFDCGEFKVYDDSYNSSYESIVAALKHIKLMKAPFSAVLGDVLEIGGFSQDYHEKIGESAYLLGCEKLYCFGHFAEDIKLGATNKGMNENLVFVNRDINSPDVTAGHILTNYHKGEIILIKGSHGLKMHRISDILKKELQK